MQYYHDIICDSLTYLPNNCVKLSETCQLLLRHLV